MKTIFLLFLSLLIISSCDFPEHYFSNAPSCKELPTTNSLSPDNQATIRDKLATKQPKEFRYFFKTFLEEDNTTYMITNFRNEATCFDVKVLVNQWDKLAGMRRVNGVSYPKELYDLTWELSIVNGQEEIVYLNMHRIID